MTDHFSELNMSELESKTSEWEKSFNCIQAISLYRANKEQKEQYVIAVMVPSLPQSFKDAKRTFVELEKLYEKSKDGTDQDKESIKKSIKRFEKKYRTRIFDKGTTILMSRKRIKKNEELFDYYHWCDGFCKFTSVFSPFKKNDVDLFYKERSKCSMDEWLWVTIPADNNSGAKAILDNYVRHETEIALSTIGEDKVSDQKADNGGIDTSDNGPTNDISISKDQGLKWEDITATFLGDNELHFQFKQEGVTRRYDHAGFADGRMKNNANKPISAWHVLLEASERNGSIPFNFDNRKVVEKHAQKLRAIFRNLFPCIKENPIPICKKDGCYKITFCLKPPPE